MSITDGLMSTEPDIRVDEAKATTGGGKAVSHAYIGVRKFLAGLTGIGTQAGMPAVGNFLLAGYHAVAEDDGESDGMFSNDEADDSDDFGVEFDPTDVGE
jgi:hypothetical protein